MPSPNTLRLRQISGSAMTESTITIRFNTLTGNSQLNVSGANLTFVQLIGVLIAQANTVLQQMVVQASGIVGVGNKPAPVQETPVQETPTESETEAVSE